MCVELAAPKSDCADSQTAQTVCLVIRYMRLDNAIRVSGLLVFFGVIGGYLI